MKPKNDEWLRNQCNKYANGTCYSARCLLPGGNGAIMRFENGEVSYASATCEAHEVFQELQDLRKLVDDYDIRPDC